MLAAMGWPQLLKGLEQVGLLVLGDADARIFYLQNQMIGLRPDS